MNGLTSLREQLPLLLIMSPVIGVIVTFVASRFDSDFVRPLAVSNAICTLAILFGLEWQFESALGGDAEIVRLAQRQIAESSSSDRSIDEFHRTLERRRVERLRHQWFAVDGLNLVPALFLAVLTIAAVWRKDAFSDSEILFYPMTLTFEAASLAVLTANDLRVFILASAASTLTIAAMIGRWGNSERRNTASRFLFAQVCGGAFITLGFSTLVVAVSWMKMQDAMPQSTISWNIASITHDIQKWTMRNELAFHYESEVFPTMLFILLLGFAIQTGVFPFHSWLIGVISGSRPMVAALFIAGFLAGNGVGWLRLVMPLAPDLLASFDRLMLIPSLGGAVWGGLRALSSRNGRERIASLLLCFIGISLLGCYSFTRIGISGAWLMQQQLVAVFCTVFLMNEPRMPPEHVNRLPTVGSSDGHLTLRTTLLLLCVPTLGLFASSFAIVSELLRESLFLAFSVFVVGLVLILTMRSELDRQAALATQRAAEPKQSNRLSTPLVLVGLVAVILNGIPRLPLHQCEPELARVFRRFEPSLPAVSAEAPSTEPLPTPEPE